MRYGSLTSSAALLRPALAVVLFCALSAPTLAQTAQEKEDLKKLGSGFVVYNKGNVLYRYDLDGSGEVNTRVIADYAVEGAMSDDGLYIVYITYSDPAAVTSQECDIWVMNSDGSGKRKINKQYISYASNAMFSNTYKIVYGAGPVSVRDYSNFPQKIWTIDFDGNETMIMDLSNDATGSYAYVSFLDMYDNWLTWRFNARAYAGVYQGTPSRSAYGSVKDFGQRCGNTFNPTGDQITINSIDHKTVQFFERSGTTWTEVGRVLSSTKHTGMQWSNVQKWVSFRKEEGDADCYAVNTENYTERVRITFVGSTGSPCLFIGEISPVKVSVTEPAKDATFTTPASVSIKADATHTGGGSITNVEFFVDGNKIGEDAAAPYEFTWTATEGDHAVGARATGSDGAVGNAAPVSIVVRNPAVFTTVTVTPSATSVTPGGTARFSASAQDQYGTAIAPQPSFAWIVSGGGAIDNAGVFTAGAAEGGPFTVTATSGGKSGSAAVVVSTITCADNFDDNAVGSQWSTVDTDGWSGGGVAETGGQLTVTARGVDVWQGDNQFVGIARSDLSGDFDVWVKVVSQGNSNAWAKCGIMTATKMDNPAQGGFCYVAVTPGNGFTFQYDVSGTVGQIASNDQAGSAAYPCWLRLVKKGTSYEAYYRTSEGAAWAQIGSAQSPQSAVANAEVGLFVTSHNSGGESAVIFDDFSCATSVGVAATAQRGRTVSGFTAAAVGRTVRVHIEDAGASGVTLVAADGRVVSRSRVEAPSASVTCGSRLPAGVYMVRVASVGRATVSSRVVVGK